MTSQTIPRILSNPKIHYCIHRSPPPVLILSQIKTSHFSKIRVNIIHHLLLLIRCGLLPSGFTSKSLYAPLLSPIRATCPARFIFLHLITQISGEEYRAYTSLFSLLYSPITTFLLGPNILLSTLFSKTLSLHSSLDVGDQVSHPCKTTGIIIALYTLKFTMTPVLSAGTAILDGKVPVQVIKAYGGISPLILNLATVLVSGRLQRKSHMYLPDRTVTHITSRLSLYLSNHTSLTLHPVTLSCHVVACWKPGPS